MAPSTPFPRKRLARSRAALLAPGLALALGAWAVIPGCGGDEPPAPQPAPDAASAPPAPVAPAALAEPGAPSAAAPVSSGMRQRFDLPVEVTPAAAGVAADAPATLRGVARLLGPVPERKQVAMDHIAGCAGHGAALTETVLALETGELQNVVVHVSRGIDKAAVAPPPEEPVVLTQEGCVFKPHVLVVRAGQTLLVKNADETNHNVNARPAHGSNKGFNRMQPPAAGDIEAVFARPEVAFSISCDIHPWMKAWVAVVDHPYSSISDENGVWSIEVPPGDYLVEAWHERYGTVKSTVEVGPGDVADFGFTFEPAKKHN